MKRRALVIGSRGGVGATLLRLLPPARLESLFLVDREVGPSRVLAGSRVLDPEAAIDPEALARTLHKYRIEQVIEVADVDTCATAAVCAAAGADYLSASVTGDAPTMVGTRALFADRPDTRGTSHLIGAGMNPGIVNALVVAGIDELARRANVRPSELDLYAIHVVEEDTTATSSLDPDVFAMSWSPRHALEELLEPHAMHVARGELVRADHRPCDARYVARCGDREIAGLMVPHEELISIGARFPGVEAAFFYAIPPAASAALQRHPDRRSSEWATRRLYAPHARGLAGHDRVGVLIASRRHGELWLGYQHAAAAPRAGNGTLLQAAAGVLAGWSLLGSRVGVHAVDELDVHAYLAIVEAVLGPRTVIHVPDARPRSIAERACGAGVRALQGRT